VDGNLQAAVKAGDLKRVKELATKRTVSSSGSRTLLHLAAAYGRLEVATYLVKLWMKASLENKKGKTPLDLAQKFGHTRIVEFFARHSTGMDRLKVGVERSIGCVMCSAMYALFGSPNAHCSGLYWIPRWPGPRRLTWRRRSPPLPPAGLPGSRARRSRPGYQCFLQYEIHDHPICLLFRCWVRWVVQNCRLSVI
jgi:hypothetical protein